MDRYEVTDKELEEYIPDEAQRNTFKEKFKLRGEQDTAEEDSAQQRREGPLVKFCLGPHEGLGRPCVQPSTSGTPGRGKRNHDDPGPVLKKRKRTNKKKLESKFKEVETIMSRVNENLNGDNNGLIGFLRELIQNLKKDKKEMVGVFGKTGAGKSSLINAVLGEKDLLPTGSSRACTSVIIKVEASSDDSYEAKIEFISEEELKDLLWSSKDLFADGSRNTEKFDDESKDNFDKMNALFGNNWNKLPYESFMADIKYKKMKNYIKETKVLRRDLALELSQELTNFTKNVRNPSCQLYWPVVKCITIKVPNCDLLRHVTLVDLPGTGDRNKTRNDMWKEMVSSCGTVWIVTEMTRAVSEREPWEILRSACSILGNGGECRNIHFICSKTDLCQDELSPEDTKNDIIQEFQALSEVQNHFPDDCFNVFIVSTKAEMPPERNEISDLEEFLESLNDPEEVVQRYVSDAYGILALMMGASSQNAQQKMAVYIDLFTKREEEISKIKNEVTPVYKSFERRLTEGVNMAKQQWESALDEKLGPINSYPKLRSIMANGVQKTITGDHINLNTTLSSFLTNSIDRQFRKTFPNTGKNGPFYGSIRAFSLVPERLIENYKDVELLLKFLKREEEKLKTKLCEDILCFKKSIYNSLTETVTNKMLTGYKEAKRKKGPGAVKHMKRIVKKFVSRNETMFDNAKDEMLKRLQKLMNDIIVDIYKHLENVMNMSLKRDMASVFNVSEEFKKVSTLCETG